MKSLVIVGRVLYLALITTGGGVAATGNGPGAVALFGAAAAMIAVVETWDGKK